MESNLRNNNLAHQTIQTKIVLTTKNGNMQDPKQKAVELVEKFKKYAHSNPNHESELFYRRLKENAQLCAVIACEFAQESPCNFEWYNRYLEEVKQEITNL